MRGRASNPVLMNPWPALPPDPSDKRQRLVVNLSLIHHIARKRVRALSPMLTTLGLFIHVYVLPRQSKRPTLQSSTKGQRQGQLCIALRQQHDPRQEPRPAMSTWPLMLTDSVASKLYSQTWPSETAWLKTSQKLRWHCLLLMSGYSSAPSSL